MSYSYELADILVRLNVAGRSHLSTVKIKYTKLALGILVILYNNGLIRGFFVESDSTILVYLKYFCGSSVIKKIVLVSRPGRRIYWHLNFLSLKINAKNFGGFYIISTPQGLFTSQQCILLSKNCGEILLKVNY